MQLGRQYSIMNRKYDGRQNGVEISMKYEIQVIRSNRRTIGLEITPDMQVIVRAPYRVPERTLRRFVEERADWLETHLAKMAARKAEQQHRPQSPKLTEADLRMLVNQAKEVIPNRVQYYAPIVGVDYGRITIRNQRTRWGSCSGKGNLNFNCLLMLTPPQVVDYVVVHELCHRLEMNHSSRFWAQVERVYPNYRQAKKWLKDNGTDIIDRMIPG